MVSVWRKARSFSTVRRWSPIFVLVLGLGLALAVPATAAAATYNYSGVWNGSATPLTHVPNVTVEGLPDETFVGTIGNFQTNDPSYSCLNGETINVFTAPSEFPSEYVVHNGLQGSQCTYGTWTFPFYTITLAAWIPQHTLNGAPLLSWTAYAVIGLSCWTPPIYEAPFVDETITGSGDGHSGYTGTDRAYVRDRITWNGSTITSFTPLSSYVATSHATAYYYIPPDPYQIHSCSIAKVGAQLSPTPSKTGSNSLSMEVKAQNKIAPPPLNPALDGAITVTVSGSAAYPFFWFSGTTELFPSYGVSVNGPSGSVSDTLFNAAGYGNPISYEVVATLLSCHDYGGCASVYGGISY